MSDEFGTIEEARKGLGDAGYLADESTALLQAFFADRRTEPSRRRGDPMSAASLLAAERVQRRA